uniref:Reverse transcriptase domain-containing protein n=1 Tax=Tanacetum cinerariifolium TaxID=118510 RepID=A0A6L2KZI1_TANCI|nr:reverse transcriptase domain-containing protein [Tanacetum cinerariifolium]
MRPFGCPVTILNTLDPLGKFQGKVDEGFLVGYSVCSKAFRVFNSQTHIIQETLHVNFLENKPNATGTGPTWLFDIDSLTRTMNYQPVTAGNQTNSGVDVAFDGKEHDFDAKKPESVVILSSSNKFEDCSANSSNEVNAAGSIVPTVRQNFLNSTNTFSVAGPYNTIVSPTYGKSSFIDASQLSNDPDMQELEDITYSDDEDVGGAEADFNNFESSIPEEGIDYKEVFAPVARIEAIRLFLAYASFMGFMVYQMDVKSAFLYRTIKEEVYVCQPLGFKDPNHPDKVYKVVKALYGLHQAPRAWYETLASCLLENGFQRGLIDQTLFIKKQKWDILLVQIYVDDIIFGATNKDLCKSFEKLMKDKFQMSSMRELTFFLGLQKPLLKDPDGEDVDVHTYSNKFCDFHNDKGHSTDECMQLKKQIEELVRAGMLSYLIKEIKHGRDQSKTGKKEIPAKDKPATIYMIQSWQRMTRQKVTQSFERVSEITFPPLTASSGVEGPLVIEAEMGGHMIHLVGETIWPLGQLRLLVTIGDDDHSTRAWMNFMIVRSLSPYNGIIRRPGIIEIQAVPSTAHRMLKFPVEGGIVTIRSTILIPAECTSVITSSVVSKEEGTRTENFKVALHPDFPDKEQPSNMTGVPRSVPQHRLNIREGYSPVWQKKRGQAPERAKAIQAEVQKLVEAGIMREVYYHDWLSNPVMVKKHDGSWRMCVDFTDLNKACLQDCYPLPEINRKVKSICGYPFKYFFDAYKGYHQIQLAEPDEQKTTFHTGQGVYCYTKMSFGLKNAGATYHRLVDKDFDSQIGQNIEVYVDDLVVKSYTEAQMLRDVDETFRTLRKINMKLNPKKCTFGAAKGVLLGYIVTPEGIKPCPDKTAVLLQLPSPRTIKKVQSLNGKLASLNRFLTKPSEKSLPLFKTFKKCIKKSNFHWTAEAEQAFKQLKKHLSELPLLVAPKPKEELIVYLFATYGAISAVLMTKRGAT